MKNIFVITFCFVIIGNCLAQTKDKTLEGKVYSVKVTENNADGRIEPLDKDEINFKSGKISSKFSLKNGFPAVFYTAVIDSSSGTKTTFFTAESTNDKKHTLKWSGTIKDKTIEGKAERSRTKNPGCDYVFNGTLKNK